MKKLYFLLVAMLFSFAANAGLYMSGNFNSWGHCDPTYEFKETSTAGVFTVSVPSLYGEFLICSGTPNNPNWNELRFGSNGSKVEEGVTYNAVKNGQGNFSINGTVNNATVTLDTNKSTLLVTGAAQQNQFTVVYLIGDIDGAGWDESLTDYPLESKGNDTYAGDITVSSVSYIKPRCGNNILSAEGEDIVPQMGQTYTLGAGDKAVMLTPGTYTVTVVVDQKAETGTIQFTSDVVTPEFPEALYIIGYIDGHDFDTLTGMKSTKAAEGVYTWENALLGDAGAGKGYINIASVVDTEGTGDWDTTVNNGNRYGAPAKDTPLAIGAPAGVKIYYAGVNASACESWAVDPGTYDVTLDLNTLKISLERGSNGIETIEADNAIAPAYFNLQGVRVTNPANGIFIEVRAGKAVKVAK